MKKNNILYPLSGAATFRRTAQTIPQKPLSLKNYIFVLKLSTKTMLICSNCHTSLPDGAKFCLHCGEAVIPRTGEQPENAPFLRYEEDLVPQMSRIFFDMLERTIKTEQDEKLYTEYSERIYTTGFRDILDIHIVQLSLQIPELQRDDEKIKKIVRDEFQHLIDFR